ncbi:hypothetical protein [Natrinema sp. CBA1119]|uniref:hypothetical protein n=1 Tax=Natrinema sp. CBA1119 TaxID=1608465 RepID=UPI001145FD6D|nr:hypothetical protein [Natrinema sp. CBA1119]
MTINSRFLRLILAIYFLIFSYAIYWEAKLPYRVTTDERLVFGDIYDTYTEGILPSLPDYPNGVGFTIIETIILRVVGGDIWDTLLIDRFVSIHTIILFVVVLMTIYIGEVPNKNRIDHDIWVLGIISSSFFIFAGFINRLFESTHISYSYALFALAIWCSFRMNTGSENRIKLLLPFLLFSIGLYNFIWAIVFGGIIVIFILLTQKLSKIVYVSMLSLIPTVLIPIYFNKVTFPVSYLLGRILNIGSTDQTISSASTKVATWRSIFIPYLGDFNVWFLYISGIAFVSLLTLSAILSIFYRGMKKEELTLLSYYVLSICFGFGMLAIMFIYTEELATLKRVLAIPGIFGILYWVSYTVRNKRRNIIRYCLVFLLISSLLFSGLASNRSMLDGGQKPYDNYVSESEIQSLNWMHNHANLEDEECLISNNPNHYYTSRKEFGYQIPRNSGEYPTGTDEILVYKNEQSSVSWVCQS